MKNLLLASTLTIVAACGLVGVSVAEEPKKDPPSTQKSDAPINKFCAIMQDHEIDPKVTYVYKDKTVGFCCAECIPDFKKDPEKYLKNIK